MCPYFAKMSSTGHRAVIKFFTWKGLNAAAISKELDNVYKGNVSKDNVYKDSTPSCHIIAKWVAEFKNLERGFEDAPRIGRP